MVSARTVKLMAIGAIVAGTLVAERKKEYHFTVGPKAGVSVVNPYGSISVKPSLNNTVVVNAVLHSDKVEVDNNQNGNRVDIQSHLLAGADAESGVTHRNLNIFAGREHIGGERLLNGQVASLDGQFSAIRHGIPGIYYKVQNGTLELGGIGDGHWAVLGQNPVKDRIPSR